MEETCRRLELIACQPTAIIIAKNCQKASNTAHIPYASLLQLGRCTCNTLRGQSLSMLGNRPRIKTTMANAGASIRLFVKNSWMECLRHASRSGIVHAGKPSTNKDHDGERGRVDSFIREKFVDGMSQARFADRCCPR